MSSTFFWCQSKQKRRNKSIFPIEIRSLVINFSGCCAMSTQLITCWLCIGFCNASMRGFFSFLKFIGTRSTKHRYRTEPNGTREWTIYDCFKSRSIYDKITKIQNIWNVHIWNHDKHTALWRSSQQLYDILPVVIVEGVYVGIRYEVIWFKTIFPYLVIVFAYFNREPWILLIVAEQSNRR